SQVLKVVLGTGPFTVKWTTEEAKFEGTAPARGRHGLCEHAMWLFALKRQQGRSHIGILFLYISLELYKMQCYLGE
ncbi:hypothetical protein ACQP3C_28915, partial [Escherichia coli]